MTTERPTWREIADMLAARMRYHAYCPEHPRNKVDLRNCPFCKDRAAWDAYLAKRDS